MRQGEWCVCVYVDVCVYLGYQGHEVMRGRDTHFQHMMSPLGSVAKSGVGLREGRTQSVHIFHYCSFSWKQHPKCILYVSVIWLTVWHLSSISTVMVLKPQAVRWWATLTCILFNFDLPCSVRWRRPAEGGVPYAEGGVSDPEGGQQTSYWEAAAASETEDMVRGHRLLTHQLRLLDKLEGIPSGILTLIIVIQSCRI